MVYLVSGAMLVSGSVQEWVFDAALGVLIHSFRFGATFLCGPSRRRKLETQKFELPQREGSNLVGKTLNDSLVREPPRAAQSV